jgi:hypothetical protein
VVKGHHSVASGFTPATAFSRKVDIRCRKEVGQRTSIGQIR